MISKRSLLLSFFAYAIQASATTYSITAESYYPVPDNPTQADAYLRKAFPFELSATTTLTFSATYDQTPHTCTDGCTQDLNTFAFTSPGLYFDSTPDQGICSKSTLAPFPCSATLPAGDYELVLEINDSTFTEDFTGFRVDPFTDSLSVTVDDGMSMPEPSPGAIALLGLCLIGLTAVRKRAKQTRTAATDAQCRLVKRSSDSSVFGQVKVADASGSV